MDDSDIGEVLRVVNTELKRTHAQLRATEKERDELLKRLETKPLLRALKYAASEDSKDLSACLGGMCPSLDVIRRLKAQLEETRRSFMEQLEESERSCARLAAENQTLLEHAGPSLEEFNELLARLDQRESALRDSEDARQRVAVGKEKWKAKYQGLRNGVKLQGADEVADKNGAISPAPVLIAQQLDAAPTQTVRSSSSHEPSHNLRNLMRSLPKAQVPTGSHQPVRKVRRGATIAPEHARSLACAPDGYLFFPGQTAFFAGHAAIIYVDVLDEPRADGRSAGWTRKDQLATLIGQTRELFFRARSTVRYAGTYKLLRTLRITPEDYRGINIDERSATRAMAAAVHAALPKAKHNDKEARKAVLEALRGGVAHYECLVLQRVGFNDALYQAVRVREVQEKAKQPTRGKRKSHPYDEEVADVHRSKRQKY